MITLRDVKRLLDAEVICGEDKLDTPVRTGCGCDLMSDVLAFAEPGTLLLTGLVNCQVVHTAEIIDAVAVVFVRGKRPQPEDRIVEMARERGMPVLATRHPLFDSCGLLYMAGIRGSIVRDVESCKGAPHVGP